MDSLWQEIIKDNTPGDFPHGLKYAGLFLESLKPTFEHFGDTLPEGRTKFIRSVGVVAKAAFIPEEGQQLYSGVFEGADSGLLRLSIAKELDTTKTSAEGADDNFVPGLAMKFLIDGKPSTNILAMYGANGNISLLDLTFESLNFKQ